MSSPSTTDAGAEAEAPPRDDLREAIVAKLTTELGDALVGSHVKPGLHTWVRVTREAWVTAGEAAQRKLGATWFSFLSGIDWLPSPYGRELDAEVDIRVKGTEPKEPAPMGPGYAGGDTRFQVFATVRNLPENWTLTLKVDLPDDDLSLPTWSKLYAGANWHEREAMEMFGFRFHGHPQPVHLYLPGDFEGHPLRKDFPLLSRRVKPWPGIVDVEPMPGEDEPADGATGAAE